MAPWRLLQSPPLSGAGNMALDEALMLRAVRTGEVVFRVYQWKSPTLSFGRNQRAAPVYDSEGIAGRGIAVVRRPTGGRALLHHREITYSVTAPVVPGAATLDVYSRVNALLLNALHSLGVPAVLAQPSARATPPGPSPCFAEPAAGEITLHGAKLVGSAQWRDAGALLQHGSIIVEDDQHIVADLLRDEHDRRPVPKPATLRDALQRAPEAGEVAGALFDSVRRMEDASARDLDADEMLAADAVRAETRYRDTAWTWRR